MKTFHGETMKIKVIWIMRCFSNHVLLWQYKKLKCLLNLCGIIFRKINKNFRWHLIFTSILLLGVNFIRELGKKVIDLITITRNLYLIKQSIPRRTAAPKWAIWQVVPQELEEVTKLIGFSPDSHFKQKLLWLLKQTNEQKP